MQNVSNDFKDAVIDPAPSYQSRIAFPDLVLDDIEVKSIGWDSTFVSGNDFTIGLAPMDIVKIELVQDIDHPIEYDFENKECTVELGAHLPFAYARMESFIYTELEQYTHAELEDGIPEFVPLGKFTVEKVTRGTLTITLDCVDRMYKAEKEYISDLMYPTTLLDILQSASEQAGIPLATTTFANSDYIVPNEPVYEGVTCRKVFAQVAELAGGHAKINRQGQLEILTLRSESVRDIDDFKYTINDVADASIEKVIVKVGDQTATKGDGDNIYTIVDNMFCQNPDEVIDELYDVLKNIDYVAYNMNRWQGDFSLDLGDRVTIDGHETYILSRKLTYTGGLREDYRAPAKSNVEKTSTGKGSMTLDIENVKTRIKVIDGEIKQTIERVENLVVGANNRLYDSQTEIVFNLNDGIGEVQIFRDQIHPYYKAISDQTINLFVAFPDSQFAEPLVELGEVTISLDVMVDVDRTVTLDGKDFDVKGNRWTKMYITKEFEENTTRRLRVRTPFSRKRNRDISIGTKLINNLSTDINVLYYRNLKVERGNIVTDWSLTPEELEANVNRASTEIKQLSDSVSIIARWNENTGRFEVTPEAIVAAINTTDGVGRVKNVGVTIDGYGLTVENGALIIRDSRNAAIITSDGLKAVYNFTSSGEYNGWQMVGIRGIAWPMIEKYQAGISVFIPENFIVETAMLYTRSASSYITGYQPSEGVVDGYYHGKNLELYIMNADETVFDYAAGSTYGVWYGSAGWNLTEAVWGDKWSPTGSGVQVKLGDVGDRLIPGEQTLFVVETSDNPSSNTKADFSLMKFDLVVEGFLRG